MLQVMLINALGGGFTMKKTRSYFEKKEMK